MSRYSPSARVWIEAVALAAVAITVLAGPPVSERPLDWVALGLLVLCGGIAHRFPIRSALNTATYDLTNVFVVAGAVLLPPGLLTLLALLVLTPESWRDRSRPGALVRWLFNVSQTLIATQAAGAVVRAAGDPQLDSLRDLAVLLVAAGLFTAIQELLVAGVICLNRRLPLLRADTLAPSAIFGDCLIGVLGITVAGLWLSKPILLTVVVPLLILAHRLTRTAHLAELAQIDVKTGLHNSQHFERALEEELAHSQRVGRPLALLFADMDLLRQVNNRYGHLAGDFVLREVSKLIRASLRPADVVARFGGEEFVALLAGTDIEEAAHLAERVRVAVAQHRFVLDDGQELACTLSIGVASYPDDAADVTSLIKAADLAMYRAKQTRNAVARAQELVSVSAAATPSVDECLAPTPAPVHPETTVKRCVSQLVVWATVVAGAASVAWSALAVLSSGGSTSLLPLLGLALVSEFLQVRVYTANKQAVRFSFSTVVTMAAVSIYPVGAPLVSMLAAAVQVLIVLRQRRTDRALFNLANPAIAAAAASSAYVLLQSSQSGFSPEKLPAALLSVATFYLINDGLVWLVVSLHTRRPLHDVVRESAWYGPIKLLLGLTGVFLGAVYTEVGLLGALVFAVPVLIMRLTLAFYAGNSQRTIQALEHQARHDLLTGLPNRTLLRQRLQQALVDSHRQGQPLALLVLDLDRFKEVNDTFGHHAGDLLLQEIGQRFREALREADSIARLGGDEFAVLLPAMDGEGAKLIARRLMHALERPLVVEGYRLDVASSVGIALSPEHGMDADTLMRRADVAMYVAKRSGGGYAVYAVEQDQNSPGRLAFAGELRASIDQDDLVLHYQPQVEYGSRRTTCVEALVRWRHPEHGLVAPDQFIPLAEQTGLIRPLGMWVLNAALQQCRAWHDAGMAVPVAVNLSMRNLHDPELPATISRLLDTWDVPAELLVIEITESTLMAEPTRAMETLTRLRAMGVRISIDDFGTGYSSLAYLKRLPVDELKIDKSFVDQMATDRNDVAIVRSTIGLGHELGLKVTAEGVEDRATWDLLATLGCDTAQGFYVSRPMPAAELTRWLSSASSALGHAAQGQGVDVDAETLERGENRTSLASDLGLELSARAA